ncbi:MAG: hypothetical protein KatS3mg040_1798 [Candidatus Kapaibacterium sp.]|nr:MAG: hypothetical protein KatS3mg040_1798 [Candidatus Kapabacteria bacterium]
MCPFGEHAQTRWVLLYTTNTLWEAEIVVGYLRSHGIGAVLVPQVDTTRALTVGELAIAKVYVPSALYLEAAHLLEEYRLQQ